MGHAAATGAAIDTKGHLGLGYATDFDFDNSQAYPAAGLQVAYVISRNQRF
ncbi:hypothetical protein [Pontibacter oryzae]|uniref:hypothetical protein n=1 Tax=Pontibacter oryzae TaxID=2304593 RepID=UPI001315342E|nr:hypothetical protein [Pontibacter oryzae]